MSSHFHEMAQPDEAAPPPLAQAWCLANRLAAYCLLNLLDDPAWLAMAFC